ncbi:hypothetical protein [Streptomyces sp. ADI95-17]|uniref:hypothetical protein n=1 Tax=Streptomyces sp. ADI95-17 TaxID=1522759 RepID=UPI000F5BA0AE|nr:hypothetical protein [Streptomyces sp. ADI95-17]
MAVAVAVRCNAAGRDAAGVTEGTPARSEVQRTGTESGGADGEADGGEYDDGPGLAPVPADGTPAVSASAPSTAERCTAPTPPPGPAWSATGRSASSGATGSDVRGGASGPGKDTAEDRCTAGAGAAGTGSDAAGSSGESPSNGAVAPLVSGAGSGTPDDAEGASGASRTSEASGAAAAS